MAMRQALLGYNSALHYVMTLHHRNRGAALEVNAHTMVRNQAGAVAPCSNQARARSRQQAADRRRATGGAAVLRWNGNSTRARVVCVAGGADGPVGGVQAMIKPQQK